MVLQRLVMSILLGGISAALVWKILQIQSNFVVLNKICGALVQGLNYPYNNCVRKLLYS